MMIFDNCLIAQSRTLSRPPTYLRHVIFEKRVLLGFNLQEGFKSFLMDIPQSY